MFLWASWLERPLHIRARGMAVMTIFERFHRFFTRSHRRSRTPTVKDRVSLCSGALLCLG